MEVISFAMKIDFARSAPKDKRFFHGDNFPCTVVSTKVACIAFLSRVCKIFSMEEAALIPKGERLEDIAQDVRKKVVKMIYLAGSGHPAGSLSCTEVLVALFFRVMRHNPRNPNWEGRDRFVLSKGHGVSALYAVMAKCGYFDEDLLWKFRQLGFPLQGHPDRLILPVLEASTGSLGHGFSIAAGIAAGLKIKGIGANVYTLLGDGEVQEGQVWECAMASAHYKLDNLCAIIDRNDYQIDGKTEEIIGLEPLDEKFKAFGWNILVIDGHNFKEIFKAFDEFKKTKGMPTVIIAKTIKGKGVSIFQGDDGNLRFHGAAPNFEEYKIAMEELGVNSEEL